MHSLQTLQTKNIKNENRKRNNERATAAAAVNSTKRFWLSANDLD
jgi:hypothetical protein